MKRLFIIMGILCLSSLAVSADGIQPGSAALVEPLSDPLEPLNRGFEAFNGGANEYLVHPIGTVYRFLVPQFVRTGVANFADNLSYPLRLVNNYLQGKWGGAWDETKRFGINSTLGVAGLWDVADKMEIKPSKEDFGQTFGHYGIGPGWYLHLPVLGPTNVRDCVGSIVGLPFNVGRWIMPTDTYRVVSGTGIMNNAFENSTFIYQYFETNYDTYAMTRAMSSIARAAEVGDYAVSLDIEPNPEESFGYLLLKPKDRHFFEKGYEHRIRLAGARRSIHYTVWPGKMGRTMVILPGLGGHRVSDGVAALAELFNRDGWNVVSLSSTLHPDFFLGLPDDRFPGDFTCDINDLDNAISLILKDLPKKHKIRGTDRCSILGYSLGALNAMFLSARECSFACDRFIAINPPRNPLAALRKIDEFFAKPRGWHDAEAKCQDLYYRIAAAYNSGMLSEGVPVTYDESCYLIGVNMRLPLVDVLDASVKKNGRRFLVAEGVGRDLGVTLAFTWMDYVEQGVLSDHCART
ncbi:MAG: VacJ family lipoprotein, partial [Victivallales bacterium]|nr:VacJ family lipoprotein [Victivallales bacterium]